MILYNIKLSFFSDNIASRGERLELLVDKTDDLSANVSKAIPVPM